MIPPAPTNGPGGPFTGYEIGEALERLGWMLIAEPDDEAELAGYEHPEIANEVWFDRAHRRVYFGDRLFETIAKHMVDRGVSGRTRQRAVREEMLRLRDEVRRGRSDFGR